MEPAGQRDPGPVIILSAMSIRFEQTFRVSTYELTPGGNARLTSLANFFQEIATQQADLLGFGYHDLRKKGIFWVLSRMRIHVNRYPVWDEKVVVETWPNGIEKIFGIRDSRIKDLDGHVMARASTAWLVVDMNTRRPVRPSDIYHQYAEKVESVFEESLEKIELPETLHPSGQKEVLFSDIDIVGHVNNVKYIEWSLDQIAPDRLLAHPVSELEINFMHESMLGDEIQISISDNEVNPVFIRGVRTSDQQEIYRMRMSFSG